MRVLIDTNIFVDYLVDQAPFADNAERIIELCENGDIVGVLTASAVTDIYYICRKVASHNQLLDSLKALFSILDIADVGKSDLLRAMDININDLEDALVAQCAKRVRADYIVTRNEKDFTKSAVPAISPEDFLHKFFPA
ncbi:DNA-binding protein [Clostridia bacterium]|nr:DNA-binding protein [Clostridia bacterium]